MTATREATIWCDGRDDNQSCPEWESGDDAASIRSMLRRKGWRVALPNGRDLCPDHIDQRHSVAQIGYV